MSEVLHFETRENFRHWLMLNHQKDQGVWLLFGKSGGPKTLTAGEALEEALCFGWIDGQINKIDEQSYRKYFALRRPNSKWSAKNKHLVQELAKVKLVQTAGYKKIEEAKQNEQWEQASSPKSISVQQIEAVKLLLMDHQIAAENFTKMSPSVQKTYTRAYLAAKTPAGQKNV